MKLFHYFVLLAISKCVFGAKEPDPECKFVNLLLGQDVKFDCCENSNIVCQDNHIIEINLKKSDITVPTLPEKFGKMEFLEKINLNDCGLTGKIPDDISNLKKLASLNFANNQLSGNIPSFKEDKDLLYLKEVELQNNNLDGIIPGVFLKKTNITTIRLENNRYLHGKAPAYTELNDCNFSNTMLCVDETNSKCTYPEVVYECYKKEIKNDKVIKSCSTANSSYNTNNDFCQCDEGFIGSGYTECVNDCQYINSIMNWNRTENCCNKSGFSCSKTSLIEIDLSRRNLNGTIPSTIGFLNKLKTLNLHYNNLEGTIPSTISNLTSLIIFDVSNNKLSGNIPSSIENLTNVKRIDCSDNEFDGSIPTVFENLPNLSHIDLSGNKFSGSIPSELANIQKLEHLYLDHNSLSGSIPSELENLVNLKKLWLDHNNLGGEIPSSIGNIPKLKYLDLSANQLSGNIPTTIGNLKELIYLYISENKLDGSIPDSIGNLSNLEHLWLHHNMLSGSIPNSIGQLSKLQILELNNNELSGDIPSSLGDLTKLEFLYLDHNKFNGDLPFPLEKLPELKALHLENNDKLYGNIPYARSEPIYDCNSDGTELCFEDEGVIENCVGYANCENKYLKGNVLDKEDDESFSPKNINYQFINVIFILIISLLLRM